MHMIPRRRETPCAYTQCCYLSDLRKHAKKTSTYNAGEFTSFKFVNVFMCKAIPHKVPSVQKFQVNNKCSLTTTTMLLKPLLTNVAQVAAHVSSVKCQVETICTRPAPSRQVGFVTPDRSIHISPVVPRTFMVSIGT